MDTDRMDLEPGHLINTYTIQAAIESGYEIFDFLRGDEPYKEGWNADRTPLYRTRAFAPHLAARLRQTAIAAGRTLKAWSTSWANASKQ
jgi:CelD/BcsL family acetyltransferase involved in cellulose biosynthesis